jgi:hypothetical protein
VCAPFLVSVFLATLPQFNTIWLMPSTESPRDGVAGAAPLVVKGAAGLVCDCEKIRLS